MLGRSQSVAWKSALRLDEAPRTAGGLSLEQAVQLRQGFFQWCCPGGQARTNERDWGPGQKSGKEWDHWWEKGIKG